MKWQKQICIQVPAFGSAALQKCNGPRIPGQGINIYRLEFGQGAIANADGK